MAEEPPYTSFPTHPMSCSHIIIDFNAWFTRFFKLFSIHRHRWISTWRRLALDCSSLWSTHVPSSG